MEKCKLFYSPPDFNYEDDKLQICPESKYLAKMTPEKPEIVKNIILSMEKTDNYFVHNDILDIALILPANMSSDLVKTIINFIDRPSANWNYEKYAKLIKKFAESDYNDNALLIASELFKLLPDSRNIEKSSIYSFGPVPESLFNNFWYKEIIEQIVPILVVHAKMKALQQFCSLLKDGILLTKRKSGEDISYYYGPLTNIEIFEQEKIHNNPIDILLWAVRTSSEQLIEKHGKSVIYIIENYYNKEKNINLVFKRVGMYLRWKWPEIDIEGTRDIRSENKGNFVDIYLHTEMYHLLEVCFGYLSENEKKIYFNYVDEEVDWDVVLPEKENEKRNRRKIYKRLYPIRKYLTDDREKEFDLLSKEFEPGDYPDLLMHVDSVGFSGFRTPKSSEELASIPFDRRIEYFRIEVKKMDNFRDEDTLEGYARIVEGFAFNDPDEYASQAEKFKGLPPACVDGMLRGLRNAIRNNILFKENHWKPVLNLCKWVVDQKRNEKLNWGFYSHHNPGWGWARNAITGLLEEGMKKKGHVIPFENRKIVWQILDKLTNDPDPDKKDERDSSFDPSTKAINTVRGTAMVDVFYYIIWVKDNINITRGFKQLPEVKKCLEKRLNPKYEKTLTIRSVYGIYFHTILSTDEQWTKDHLDVVFPENKIDSFISAFGSYIKFNRPHKKSFIILKNKYEFAIDIIKEFKEEESSMGRTDERIAEHIMTLYWHGDIDFNKPANLLPVFYQKASYSLRAHAINFIGRSLNNVSQSDVNNEIIQRLKKLWENRISKAGESEDKDNFKGELASFGSWFITDKLDYEWLLYQLEAVLNITGYVENDLYVIEKLEKISDKYPMKAITCLDYMIENVKEPWKRSSWLSEIKIMLEKVLHSDNKKAKTKAIDLIHTLGSYGFLELRELFLKYKINQLEELL